ncbi:Unknown protein [Striga hermonthica]|uniref:Uncharacterized protein n=1 Tax=Striga hermonthica TaxID=68872 RepID=A0A9N7NB13_STRHE|nr:Unknown protein [Striga hermonthica]
MLPCVSRLRASPAGGPQSARCSWTPLACKRRPTLPATHVPNPVPVHTVKRPNAPSASASRPRHHTTRHHNRAGRVSEVEWVSDLLLDYKKKWNVPLIQKLFTDQEATEILNIPLEDTANRDIFIWVEEKNGIFSVKSCYNSILDMKKKEIAVPESSTSAAIKRKMWSATWSPQGFGGSCSYWYSASTLESFHVGLEDH